MEEARERELPYAWVILGMACFALALTRGIRATIGLLVHPWQAEFGWDRASVSLTASFGLLVYGLTQPLVGRWADRYGPRAVFVGSIALLGMSSVLVGFIQRLWHAYLAFGVGVMAATGGASHVTAAAAIARWIWRRKALAIGIVMGGHAAGQLVLVPAFAGLIRAWGWRPAFVGSGLGVLLIAVPMLLFFLKDDPPGAAGARAAGPSAEGRPLSLAQITRQANFWRLMGSYAVCGFTTAGLIDPHLIPYAEDLHIDTMTAATAFGVLGVFNLLGTLAAGAVSDRLGHRWVLGSIYAGRALTLVFLIFVRGPVTLFIFAVAFGIVDLATAPPTTALAMTLFTRSGATVVGLLSLGHQVGSAAGSYAGGLVHTTAGSYTAFFLAGALLCVGATAMSCTISKAPEPALARPLEA